MLAQKKKKLLEGWVWKFVPDLRNSIWQNVTSESILIISHYIHQYMEKQY